MTPWRNVFPKQSIFTSSSLDDDSLQLEQDLKLPCGFDFEEDMFEFVEIKIENYPKQLINDIISLVDSKYISISKRNPPHIQRTKSPS